MALNELRNLQRLEIRVCEGQISNVLLNTKSEHKVLGN